MTLTSPASANVYSVDYIIVDAHMYIHIQHVKMVQFSMSKCSERFQLEFRANLHTLYPIVSVYGRITAVELECGLRLSSPSVT